jgi:hypothetical protein
MAALVFSRKSVFVPHLDWWLACSSELSVRLADKQERAAKGAGQFLAGRQPTT